MKASLTEIESLYRPKRERPELVDVPPLRFLLVDGTGSPDRDAFRHAIEALYAVAYTAAFSLKKAQILHVDPCSEEQATIEAHAFIRADRLWTVLRQPVAP